MYSLPIGARHRSGCVKHQQPQRQNKAQSCTDVILHHSSSQLTKNEVEPFPLEFAVQKEARHELQCEHTDLASRAEAAPSHHGALTSPGSFESHLERQSPGSVP